MKNRIVGIMILFCGTTIVIGGLGAIADRSQPQYVIGFCLLLFGCLVLAIGAKAMGWIS
jgi:hypothetical protein